MPPPLRDSHQQLGLPVSVASRGEVQRAFRHEMRLRMARREQPEVAFELVALQRAYWVAIANARPDARLPKPLWQALFLAGVILLAVFVLTGPLSWVPSDLRALIGIAGLASLVLAGLRRRLGPDRHEFLESDVLELLAIRTPQHDRPFEPPFLVEAPTEGVRLAAAVALETEHEDSRIVFAKGTPLPSSASIEITLSPNGSREVDLRFMALDTAGDEGEVIRRVRAFAPRPLRPGELVVDVSVAANGMLTIAAHDRYADRPLRVESLEDPNLAAPVSADGYRG